jgi:hypothetical protein
LVRTLMINVRAACLVVAAFAGCQSAPPPGPPVRSYLVTEQTIDVGMGLRLCVAVDLSDPAGVWWWGPGSTGCTSRSTGPALFRPEGATVTPTARSGVLEIAFRLGTHSATRPFVDVGLVIDGGTLRAAGSSEAVRLVSRSDLEIPEIVGRGSVPR